MTTIVAFRIPFTLKNELKSNEDRLLFIKNIINRDPEDYLDEDDWSYETKANEWTLHNPDNQWHLDYTLSIEKDGSDITEKASLNQLNSLSIEGISLLKKHKDVIDIKDGFIHILYFYNGAASGLEDIK
jgi:hypothetical protein